VQQKYPDRLFCCGMFDARQPGYYSHAEELVKQGFRAIKIPANRLVTDDTKIYLTNDEMMKVFNLMEKHNIILSIDLADGAEQVGEMNEIIAEFPKLKIAIGHFGMVTRKDWQEQIKLARNKNVMIESGGITWLFNDEFYPFTGAVWAIKEAVELAGIEKLMWGSDYPRTMTAITYRMSYDFIVKSNLLSQEEKSLFLGKNAADFYKFKQLKQLPYIKNMVE
jgi:predicted TIM-barrel fold metal-dependent hydrolase